MRKLYLLLIFTGLVSTGSFGQSYMPFPTGEARWNQLNWHQIVWYEYTLSNYFYIQTGDTIIDSQAYHKIYTNGSFGFDYIGAIREDENRRIFFYPQETYFSLGVQFPTNDQEYLLYDFNELFVGKVLDINGKLITIVAIDSIEVDGQQRRRFQVEGTGSMFGPEYWIEGIGSSKELFSVYTYEFEWQNYTTCFSKDNEPAIFINTPDDFFWEDCEYYVGIDDIKTERLNIYPNPASDHITVTTPNLGEHLITIYNSRGQLVLQTTISSQRTTLNVSSFPEGIYYVRLQDSKGVASSKFIKR